MLNLFGETDHNSITKVLSKTRGALSRPISNLFNKNELNNETWEELEDILISSDVGFETSTEIVNKVKNQIREQGSKKHAEPYVLLKSVISDMLNMKQSHWSFKESTSTMAIIVIGVNGAGKTTTIAKLSNWYRKTGKSVLIGAGDTFRAAALEQINHWGTEVEVDVIGNQMGSDPSSVAYDAISAAQNRNIDIVLIDTAGRLQSETNLMKELEKIHRTCTRITKPGYLKVLLTIDATTGQNGLIQAKRFNESIPCNAIFLTKLDGTSKGGISIPIVKEMGIPISFIGTGESLEDIAQFDAKSFTEGLLP